MIRKMPCISATSVSLIFPSVAFIFNCLQIVSSSFPSSFNLFFRTAQYVLAPRGVSCSVKTPTTSTTEKYHFSFSLSQTDRISLFSYMFISFIHSSPVQECCHHLTLLCGDNPLFACKRPTDVKESISDSCKRRREGDGGYHPPVYPMSLERRAVAS